MNVPGCIHDRTGIRFLLRYFATSRRSSSLTKAGTPSILGYVSQNSYLSLILEILQLSFDFQFSLDKPSRLYSLTASYTFQPSQWSG